MLSTLPLSPSPSLSAQQVPSGVGGGGSSAGEGGTCNLWGEEESDLIRSCAALSSALGVQKSFSTSDISGVGVSNDGELSRTWVSEVGTMHPCISYCTHKLSCHT